MTTTLSSYRHLPLCHPRHPFFNEPMTEPKTLKNGAGVDKFLAGITDEQKRADCRSVLELMKDITGEPAAMWGTAIVGFGTIHYKGKSSEGDWPRVAFSPRKANLTVYLYCSFGEQTDLLEKLGTHKLSGKSCLQIKKMEDIHIPTLKKLIKKSYKSPVF